MARPERGWDAMSRNRRQTKHERHKQRARGRRQGMILLAGLALVIVVGGVLVYIFFGRTRGRRPAADAPAE